MSGINILPIKITTSSLISGNITNEVHYPILPISVTRSVFTVIIVGYKDSGTVRTVFSVGVINSSNREILDFIEQNPAIDGYFILYESDKSRQQQILQQIPVGYQLPF